MMNVSKTGAMPLDEGIYVIIVPSPSFLDLAQPVV
jgi:hypothetical protein